MKKLIFALIFVVLAVPCAAEIITIDANGTGDYPTIQAAIDDANDGDTIILLPGRYTGDGNRDIDYLGKAITVRGTDPNDLNIVETTIIDCNGSENEPHRGFNFINDEGPDSILSGITIFDSYFYCKGNCFGGGVYCYGASPTISNCKFEKCFAYRGEAIYFEDSNSIVTNCIITKCSYSGILARYSNIAIKNCHFSEIFLSACGYVPGKALWLENSNAIIINTDFIKCGYAVDSYRSNPVLINCSISNNSYGIKSNKSNLVVEDCILNENYESAIIAESGSLYVDNCNIINNYHPEYDTSEINGSSSDDVITNSITDSNEAYSNWYRNGGGISCRDCNPVITNCTISNNSACYYGGGMGGGIYCEQSSPVISNCIISQNFAYSDGGGIYIKSNGRGEISNCVISENTTQSRRGNTIYIGPNSITDINNCTISQNFSETSTLFCEQSNPTIRNCDIINNNGGGISCREGSSPTITDCEITGNLGGGIYGCEGTISNCLISQNYSGYEGGGISNCSGPITNCIIKGNISDSDGGGIFYEYGDMAITNCVITGNLSKYEGGGVYYDSGSIRNCVISGNSASSGGGLFQNSSRWSVVSNCIIRDNYARSWPEITGNRPSRISINYSNVKGGWEGIGNIDADPCFVSPGYWGNFNDPNIIGEPNDVNAVWFDGDYHLMANSPCVDTGDPNTDPNVVGTIDLDGNERFMDGDSDGDIIIDMGAYEYYLLIEAEMYLTPRVLNVQSKGKWVKAHFVLPAEYGVDDVDVDSPLVLEPLGIEAEYMNVFINDAGLTCIEAGFKRADFGSMGDYGPAEITVQGRFINGNCFYGTATIKVIDRRMEQLGILSEHWLDPDCGHPHWCDGSDMNEDGVVNLEDFALIDSSGIEISVE